jgi:hypothetical protein
MTGLATVTEMTLALRRPQASRAKGGRAASSKRIILAGETMATQTIGRPRCPAGPWPLNFRPESAPAEAVLAALAHGSGEASPFRDGTPTFRRGLMRSGWLLVGLLALVPVGVADGAEAPAPAATRATTDEALCRQAARRFMDAFDAGDVRALGELTWVEPNRRAQEQGLAATLACVTARRSFDAAIARRFGAGAATARAALDPTRFSAADRAAVDAARFDARGANEATLSTSPGAAPIVLRRVAAGAPWRVEVRGLATLYDTPRGNPEPGSARRIEHARRIAAAIDGVTARVDGEAGFATADAAEEALRDAVDEVGGR